jgi:hypothetical protein
MDEGGKEEKKIKGDSINGVLERKWHEYTEEG